jgi:hypothetical protein
LARRGSNIIYNTIPKFQEWLIKNCVVNVIGGALPWFYIFKGEKLKDDYVKFCQLGTWMVMQKKAWMTSFLGWKHIIGEPS